MFSNKKVEKIKQVVDCLYESISHNPNNNSWAFNFTNVKTLNMAKNLCEINNLKINANESKKTISI